MTLSEAVETVGRTIDVAGIGIIVLGAVIASALFLTRALRGHIGGLRSVSPEPRSCHPPRSGVPRGWRHHPHCRHLADAQQRRDTGRDRHDPNLPQHRAPGRDGGTLALARLRRQATGRRRVRNRGTPFTWRLNSLRHGARPDATGTLPVPSAHGLELR